MRTSRTMPTATSGAAGHNPWEADERGRYVLMARGTDEKGRKQPVTDWNYQRKHFDGIVPVDIEIE